jgi:hypothetical protein
VVAIRAEHDVEPASDEVPAAHWAHWLLPVVVV